MGFMGNVKNTGKVKPATKVAGSPALKQAMRDAPSTTRAGFNAMQNMKPATKVAGSPAIVKSGLKTATSISKPKPAPIVNKIKSSVDIQGQPRARK